MKKFFILFTVFFLIFSTISPAFASWSDWPPVPPEVSDKYVVIVRVRFKVTSTDYVNVDGLIASDSPFVYDSVNKTITRSAVNYYRIDDDTGEWFVYWNKVPANHVVQQIYASNHDIMDQNGNVFFSETLVPVVIPARVEEIPGMMIQVGGIVFGVALMILSIILVPSLVRRLVYSFLR